jgi:hypothetical protein
VGIISLRNKAIAHHRAITPANPAIGSNILARNKLRKHPFIKVRVLVAKLIKAMICSTLFQNGLMCSESPNKNPVETDTTRQKILTCSDRHFPQSSLTAYEVS